MFLPFLVLLTCLVPPIQCRIDMVLMDILLSFLILKNKTAFTFILNMLFVLGLFEDILYQIKEINFILSFI